jgi:hypothetical protein
MCSHAFRLIILLTYGHLLRGDLTPICRFCGVAFSVFQYSDDMPKLWQSVLHCPCRTSLEMITFNVSYIHAFLNGVGVYMYLTSSILCFLKNSWWSPVQFIADILSLEKEGKRAHMHVFGGCWQVGGCVHAHFLYHPLTSCCRTLGAWNGTSERWQRLSSSPSTWPGKVVFPWAASQSHPQRRKGSSV